MIKLIALDLDGTLVNDRLQIAKPILNALKHIMQQGKARVVIATGRMFYSALPFAHELGIIEPLVVYQGAMTRELVDGYPLRGHSPIDLPVAEELLRELLAEDYHVNLYINEQLWTHPHNHYAAAYSRLSGIQPVFSDNLLSCLTHAPTKMLVIDDERLDHLLDYLDRTFQGRLAFCRSRSNFCEIIDSTVSKWNAVKALADEWGILPNEIMAIGDQANDLSMIQQAGIGVAMGNAPDLVKMHADFVAPSIEENGVLEALERFVIR